MRFAAIDFETTGVVKGWPNEPWQMGICTFSLDGGVHIMELWETFFKVDFARPFSRHAPGRWAQIREILAESPSFYDIWPEIARRITGVALIAHNASTERGILSRLAPLTRLGPWHDTLKIVRSLPVPPQDSSLGTLCEAANVADEARRLVPGRTWHDALFDSVATAFLFSKVAGRSPSSLFA